MQVCKTFYFSFENKFILDVVPVLQRCPTLNVWAMEDSWSYGGHIYDIIIADTHYVYATVFLVPFDSACHLTDWNGLKSHKISHSGCPVKNDRQFIVAEKDWRHSILCWKIKPHQSNAKTYNSLSIYKNNNNTVLIIFSLSIDKRKVRKKKLCNRWLLPFFFFIFYFHFQWEYREKNSTQKFSLLYFYTIVFKLLSSATTTNTLREKLKKKKQKSAKQETVCIRKDTEINLSDFYFIFLSLFPSSLCFACAYFLSMLVSACNLLMHFDEKHVLCLNNNNKM